MKSFIRLLFVSVIMMAAGAQHADAQLGNLLKKAKKTLESVTGGETAQPGQQAGAKAKAVPIPSGGTMENPLSSAVDFELVGAYGKSTSANYGTVYLVLKVKMIMNKTSIQLGGTFNGVKTMAVDQDGNSYLTNTSSQSVKEVTEGMFVKVRLDDRDAQFQDVRKTAKTMQMIRMGCYVDAANRGIVTFHNVPVQWDVEPE